MEHSSNSKTRFESVCEWLKTIFNFETFYSSGLCVLALLAICLSVASIAWFISTEKPDLQIIGTGPVTFKGDTAFVEANGSLLPVDVVITKGRYPHGGTFFVDLLPQEKMTVTAFALNGGQPNFFLGKERRDCILIYLGRPDTKYWEYKVWSVILVFVSLVLFYICYRTLKRLQEDTKKKRKKREGEKSKFPAPKANS